MQFQISNLILHGYENTSLEYCANWTILTFIDFKSFSSIELIFDGELLDCSSLGFQSFYKHPLIIPIITSVCSLSLGIVSLFLNWRYFIRTLDYFSRNNAINKLMSFLEEKQEKEKIASLKYDLKVTKSKQKAIKRFLKMNEVSLKTRLLLADGWFYMVILGNSLQILSSGSLCLHYLTSYELPIDSVTLMLGLTAFIDWLFIIKYIETAATSVPYISGAFVLVFEDFIQMILGITPVLAGFVVIFVCALNFLEKFKDMKQVIITIIAVMFGDILNETFLQIENVSAFAIFLLSLVVVVYYTSLQNIFVMVFMEGYDRMVYYQRRTNKKLAKKREILKKFAEEEDLNEERNIQEMIAKRMDTGNIFGEDGTQRISMKLTEMNIPIEAPSRMNTDILLGLEEGEPTTPHKKITMSSKAFEKITKAFGSERKNEEVHLIQIKEESIQDTKHDSSSFFNQGAEPIGDDEVLVSFERSK